MKRVKRILFVAVLMAMGSSLLITSCTNRETEEPKEAVSAISQPEIITQLEAFNATLGATGTRMPLRCPHTVTMGWEICWQCWMKILMRDVWGTYDAAMNGPQLQLQGHLPSKLPVSYSIETVAIMGAGSSYMGCVRGVNSGSESKPWLPTPEMVKSRTFSAGYAEAKDLIKSEDYALGETVRLDENSIQVGILHNKILDEVEDIMEKGNEDILIEKLSSEQKELVNSKEFITTFDKIVNTDVYSAFGSEKIKSTSELILELFEEALNLSSMDEKTIENIINEYVAIVKKSNELSEKEKGCLYVSFAVAWYSYHYWENWNLTHSYR